ncbi:hypothetical protein SAZ11_35360 [Streptomyces sp. FXJ1.4098]|nr:hypothetical protein [Streptomyces sp. FXJ1.4098]
MAATATATATVTAGAAARADGGSSRAPRRTWRGGGAASLICSAKTRWRHGAMPSSVADRQGLAAFAYRAYCADVGFGRRQDPRDADVPPLPVFRPAAYVGTPWSSRPTVTSKPLRVRHAAYAVPERYLAISVAVSLNAATGTSPSGSRNSGRGSTRSGAPVPVLRGL